MDEKKLMERYPSAYRRVRAWMEEHGDTPAAPSELVPALGFITREEVIRRILSGADWAKEEGGRYVFAPSDGKKPEVRRSGSVPASPEEKTPESPLSETVRRILKKESERNRIGVSATYLKRLTGNPPDEELTALLNSAPWAVRQYGFYRYAEAEAAEPARTEKTECVQLTMEVPEGADPAGEVRQAEAGAEKEQPAMTGSPAPAPSSPETPPSPESPADERGSWQQLSMSIPDDEREEMRVGTVLRVKRRARSLSATVDFGSGLGKASVRIPAAEEPRENPSERWIGQQIVCGVRMVGGSREVRLIGISQETGLVALTPAEQVRNGERVE